MKINKNEWTYMWANFFPFNYFQILNPTHRKGRNFFKQLFSDHRKKPHKENVQTVKKSSTFRQRNLKENPTLQ